MCLYPKIEGWQGPSAATVAADDKTLADFDTVPTATAGPSSAGRGCGLGLGPTRGGYRGGRGHGRTPYNRF